MGWNVKQALDNLRKEQMQSSQPFKNESSMVKRPMTGKLPAKGSTAAKHIVHEATSRSQDSGRPTAGTYTHLAR